VQQQKLLVEPDLIIFHLRSGQEDHQSIQLDKWKNIFYKKWPFHIITISSFIFSAYLKNRLHY